jgi:hypothetical protein
VAGKVGKTVYSRSGRNLPPHRPKKIFDREEVLRLRHQGQSYRQIAKSLGLGVGNGGADASGTCQKFVRGIWTVGAKVRLNRHFTRALAGGSQQRRDRFQFDPGCVAEAFARGWPPELCRTISGMRSPYLAPARISLWPD